MAKRKAIDFSDLFLDEEYYRPNLHHILHVPLIQRMRTVELIVPLVSTLPLMMKSKEDHPKQNQFFYILEVKSDIDFFKHLRLSRRSFTRALELIQDAYGPKPPGKVLYLGTKSSLYLTLWYLGTQSTYSEIAELFGVAKSTVFECVQRVIDVLCEAGHRHITWPTSKEVVQFENDFRSIGSIPGVIGAVDCCHIRIKGPSDTLANYRDRTHKHSVNLMAVCSPGKRFTFIQAGFPGSAHNARVFKSCSLFNKMQENDISFFPSPKFHIIGDSAFGLHKYLMVPFKNTSNLSAAEIRFNRKLSKGRAITENTFVLLKSRFKRLNYIETDIDRIPKIIKACCVLHNIALNSPEDITLLEAEGPLEASLLVVDRQDEWTPSPQHEGIQKRQALLFNQ